MNCIAKKKNGEPCRNNAIKNATYCYVHSFGRFRGIPWWRNSTIHAIIIGIVGIIVAVYFGFFGATKKGQEEIKKAVDDVPQKTAMLIGRDNLDSDKISLILRYAHGFDNYLGATDDFGNEDRKIDPKIPLRKKYEPNVSIGFTLGIFNENEGIPFESMLLEVVFPDEAFGVEYGEGWQPQRVNKRYTYYFPLINNTPLNTCSQIRVKFPGPGEYTISCVIDGRDIRKIHVPIGLVLY